MRHSLFKYFSERKWAEAFLDGQVLFRSLSYFRDHEDKGVRGDQDEGTATFRPVGGLIVNNLTRGTTFTLLDHSFESAAKQGEIFVFCASRSHNDERRKQFEAVVCIEILKIKTLCDRIKAALPPEATFYGRRVEYYQETEGGNPRWALPEKIATSKLHSYAWQDEYRLLFSLTDALTFENVAPRLVQHGTARAPKPTEHQKYLVEARSLRDICVLHEF
jgi:hypothetical protein